MSKLDKNQRCSAEVFDEYAHHQCLRGGAVKRNGKLYCNQHDPERVAERHRARVAKWNAELAADVAAAAQRNRIDRAGREVEVTALAHAASSAPRSCQCPVCSIWARSKATNRRRNLMPTLKSVQPTEGET